MDVGIMYWGLIFGWLAQVELYRLSKYRKTSVLSGITLHSHYTTMNPPLGQHLPETS